MRNLFIATLVALSFVFHVNAEESRQHLFILSGQSNMKRLDPNASFTPAVTEKFGAKEVIVVKDAMGGQPIRRWYKAFKPANDWKTLKPAADQTMIGDLYDNLMKKVYAAIKDKTIKTVTFVWMQGETDAEANEMHGAVYGASLRGLVDQLRKDMGRSDVNVVIGRINDCHMDNQHSPHWTMVREAQVKFAESSDRYAWVDTDDLNGSNNDIHMQGEGYKILGKRFAEKAIELINKPHQPNAGGKSNEVKRK